VELRFVTPELARLDERLSDLERRGLVTGELGEVVLLAGKPRLSFDKVLVFGAGPRASFGEEAFHTLVLSMLATLEGLLARVSVVELPGRHDGLIAAERAADILLACAGRKTDHDAWTLVEDQDGRQRIVQHMIEERRRVRRVF
jgi:hypothetical protein